MPLDTQDTRAGKPRIDFSRYRLTVAGRPARLERQPMELLILFVQRKGHLVAREDIVQKLWGKDVFVDVDASINSAVGKIRAALRDDPERPKYLETVIGKGYRFIGEIEVAGGDSSTIEPAGAVAEAAPSPVVPRRRRHIMIVCGLVVILIAAAAWSWFRWRAQSGPQVSQIHSIAVLPLANLSGDPAQEYFADGMTDELITEMAQIGSLRVISRTSAMHYKATTKLTPEIAKELNVDAVLEGSVVRSGGRVRITAQLIEARADKHLWASIYEAEPKDVLGMQAAVARDVVKQIRLRLTTQEQERLSRSRPVNPEAYEAYLKGRYVWSKRTEPDLRKALEYFEEAIRKDPGYARAYAGLADTYMVLGSWIVEAVAPADAFPRVRAAAEKAIQLDESMAEARASLAGIEHIYDWDWLGAGTGYRRAIELSPSYSTVHDWYGQYLCQLSRFDEGIAETVRAHNLDPLNMQAGADVGLRLYWAGRYDEAVEPIQNTLKLDPNFVPAHRYLGQVYEQQGKYQQAIAEFQTDSALTHENPISLAALAHAYAVSGDKRRALSLLALLKKLSKERYVSGYTIALVYTGLGRKDDALEALEQAYRERSTWMVHLNIDPRLNPLRSDRRFQDLVRRVGLPSSPSANL